MRTSLHQAIVVSSFKFELKSLKAAGANWDIEHHYFETSVNPENAIGSVCCGVRAFKYLHFIRNRRTKRDKRIDSMFS